LLDIAPTVVDLLGLPAERRFEGHSLVPLLAPQSWRGRLRAWWRGAPSPADVLFQLESTESGLDLREHQAGILRRSLKVLMTTGGQPESYDLETDPQEKDANPVALEADAAVLAKVLEADRVALDGRSGLAVKSAPLDESTREKLRALGYHF